MTLNKLKYILSVALFGLLITGCEDPEQITSIDPVNWNSRLVNHPLSDSLERGQTYLSVYSEIYSMTMHRTHDLTATISLRNTSAEDSIFITHAEYFNTAGKSLRNYFEKPIYLRPMETVEIIIDEHDRQGGSGANFIFDWVKKPNSPEPLFEGVMITTSAQLGLSFTTTGQRIK